MWTHLYRTILIAIFIIVSETNQREKQWMFASQIQWDKEWKDMKWKYMETVPIERSRLAVIGTLRS